MKKITLRILFTTGAALVLLSIYMKIIGVEQLNISHTFEILAANTQINIGLFFRHKFEIRNVIIEYIIDISYLLIVLLVFGKIFDWYPALPVWYLVIMAVVIYIAVIVTTVVKIHKDTQEINALLKKRDEKQSKIAL